MNYIKNVGDNQNKFGDTATVFQIGLMKDDEVYNFGDNQVTVNIANETGYVLSVTPDKFLQNTVLNLDFNKVPLKNLTPDNYQLEVEVKSTDGDIAKFPTSGSMTFSINHDLKETSGALVPNVTFDNVLDAVDEKIAVYMDTVKVGPQGPVGPAGNVDTSHDNTFTGINTFTNKIIATAGVQGNADTATKLQTPRKINGVGFDGTSDIIIDPSTRVIIEPTDLFTLANGFYLNAGAAATNKPGSSTYRFSVEVIQTSTNGFMRLIDSNGLSFWTTKNGDTWGTWKQDADDSTVVHNTRTETVAGDKTFTGQTTLKAGNYGLRVTTTGIQKTSDGGTTWANI